MAELSNVEKILVSTHGFTDNGDGTVSSPKGALFDTEQGGYYTATGAAPVDRSSNSSADLEATSSNSNTESSGPGTKYLKTEGVLTYGAQQFKDLPSEAQEAISNSDRHTVNSDGTISFTDSDGSQQLMAVGTDDATVDVSAIDPDVIQKAAEITFLAQNGGVLTSDMKAVYESLGLDPNDTTASYKKDKILKELGYNPGSQETFFGSNSGPQDVGAQIILDRLNQKPTEQDLIDAGLDPAEVSVSASNANWYLEQEMKKRGLSANQTYGLWGSGRGILGGNQSSLGMTGATNVQEARDELDRLKGLYGADNPNWKTQENVLDILEWDLIKKKAEEKKTGGSGSVDNRLTGNINTGGGTTTTGGNITGGATGDGTYTGPNFVSTPNIGAITPVYGTDQTGLTEVDIPTYEKGLEKQETQFDNRAIESAKLLQPQTLEEKEAAGEAPAFENRMYRNRFGMVQYIQFIKGPDGIMRPTTPIPQGYYEVQGFGAQQQATGAAQGGVIQSFSNGGLPEGVTIGKIGNRYGYFDPLGNRINVRDAAGNLVTYQNADYALSGASSNPDVVSALEGYNPYTGDLNPAMNYQPGGNIIQSGDGYQIQYPGEGGATSQVYGTYGQALAANQAGLSGLGLPDYQTYLTQQGVNTANPGYDEALYKSAYQTYLQDPATLEQIKFQQQQSQQEEIQPVSGTVGADQPLGETTVTPEDLAQYQANLNAQAFAQPGGAVAASPVSYLDPNSAGTVMASTTGQALGTAPMVQDDQVAQISSATTADVPTGQGAATYDANQAFGDVQQATTGMTAATSTGPTKTITAEEQKTSSVSDLDAAASSSIDVTGQPTRTLQTGPDGELIQGTGVDQAKVGEAFGTGEVQAASVQGELANLMSQFEGGDTPAWAAGSMRAASQMLAARGLGASSMAGQAVIQAAMEAALPIAQIDTANKQQVALFKAEQRAKFLQMDFDQAFQAKVMNAAKVSEIANMNFTAEQQIALENSKAANTMELQNLSNEQALVMAEAAALSQLDTQNLSNRQQAAVQNAQNFLQIDMANLSNEQQTATFKQQSIINSILSDQAAANAAAQFNATSENQTNQFFSNLSASVNQFNAAQMNAMKQFNADEVNSLLEFNAALQNQREMFNAQNYLVVAQANAQWRQNVDTINTAAANQSNMEYAKNVNNLTQAALDEIWMRERDLLSMAFQSSENTLTRNNSIMLQKLAANASVDSAKLQADIEAESGASTLLASVFMKAVGLI